jgi:hypothetical protein
MHAIDAPGRIARARGARAATAPARHRAGLRGRDPLRRALGGLPAHRPGRHARVVPGRPPARAGRPDPPDHRPPGLPAGPALLPGRGRPRDDVAAVPGTRPPGQHPDPGRAPDDPPRAGPAARVPVVRRLRRRRQDDRHRPGHRRLPSGHHRRLGRRHGVRLRTAARPLPRPGTVGHPLPDRTGPQHRLRLRHPRAAAVLRVRPRQGRRHDAADRPVRDGRRQGRSAAPVVRPGGRLPPARRTDDAGRGPHLPARVRPRHPLRPGRPRPLVGADRPERRVGLRGDPVAAPGGVAGRSVGAGRLRRPPRDRRAAARRRGRAPGGGRGVRPRPRDPPADLPGRAQPRPAHRSGPASRGRGGGRPPPPAAPPPRRRGLAAPEFARRPRTLR